MTAVLFYAISSFSSKSSCRKLRVDSDRAKCRAPTRFEQPFKGQLSASLPQGDSVLAAAAEKQLALQKKSTDLLLGRKLVRNCVLAAAALFSIERMAALAEWRAGACPFAYCSR